MMPAPEVVAMIEAEVGLPHQDAEVVMNLLNESMTFSSHQLRFMEYLVTVAINFATENAAHITSKVVDGKEEIVYDEVAAADFENRVQGAADVAVFLDLTPEQVDAVEDHSARIIDLSREQQDFYLRIALRIAEDTERGTT